jgi:ABC-type bacteriocin/lantibiotic exporter with double-glycine peptidase domain
MELLRYTYKQKNDWSCGPAVARVILDYYGTRPTISSLTKQLKTTRAGTENRYVISLFKRNNLRFFARSNSSIAELQKYSKNYWLIVAYWIPSSRESHYSIIKKINSRRVYFHDTWFGSNHSYSLKYFLKNWHDDEATRWFIAVKK